MVTSDIRDRALTFEAKKIGFTQDKNGFVLKLSIHPNDIPRDLANAWVGSRFQVAMVLVGDDDQPASGVDTEEGIKAVRISGALCRNERFQGWLGVLGEAEAVNEIHSRLGITSRADLKTNVEARERFFSLRERFRQSYNDGELE